MKNRSAPPHTANRGRPPALVAILWISCLAIGACYAGEKPRTSDLPNVILIVLDTFRADHLGAYGNKWVRTPALDAFAREAVVFERASSAAPWTLPSMATLFTGLLPCEHGVVGGKYNLLSPDHFTLAEFLKEHGFFTQGFVAHDYLTADFGMDQGFDDLEAFVDGPVSGRIDSYEDDLLTFLSDPPGFPFFLLVHYFDAHPPYLPPGPFDAMYYSGDPRRKDQDSLAVIYEEDNLVRDKAEQLYKWLKGVTDIDYPVKQYAAGISHVDHHVGVLIEGLRRTGELDRSIVIITADHGEHLTEHSIYFTHRYPYEETLHIPLLIRLPDAAHAGRLVKEEVSNIDLFPTLAELLGLTLPGTRNAASLVPLMTGEGRPGKSRLLFAEFGTPGRYTRSVSNGRFRLVKFDNYRERKQVRLELYDHSVDPLETRDVSAEYPEMTAALKSILWRRFSGYRIPGKAAGPRSGAELSPDVLKRLEQLGY